MAPRWFNLLDEWLKAVDADNSDDPLAAKLVRHKPAEARDGCFTGGQHVEDDAVCDAAHSDNVMPRIVAGEPLTADVLKCQLKPPDPADCRKFNIEFSDEEWARLQAAFPEGVCDFTRPASDIRHRWPADGWLTLAGPSRRASTGTRTNLTRPGAAAVWLRPRGDLRRPDDVWGVHRDNVACATALEIVRDFGDNTYRPAAVVRRDQMASFVVADARRGGGRAGAAGRRRVAGRVRRHLGERARREHQTAVRRCHRQ